MNVVFNFHSQAARKARFAVFLSKTKRTVITLIAALFMLGGGALVLVHPGVGMLVFAIGLALILPLLWHHYDLDHMPAHFTKTDQQKVEEILETDVVGRLVSIETPVNIWQGARGSWQQNFFALRYGIPTTELDIRMSTDPNRTEQVWVDALKLADKHDRGHISSGSLLVALIKSIDDYESFLSGYNLDIEELESSIDWINHTQSVMHRLGKQQNTGGLARDWTAGYTPTLNSSARNVSAEVEQSGFAIRDLSPHKSAVDEIMAFMANGRANVALVGELGSGKTTTVYSFAQQLMTNRSTPKKLKYMQVFALDASTLIAQSEGKEGLENVVISILNEASRSRNTILFFDEAQLFFSEGTGSVDLSRILMPAIEAGGLPMIFALSPTDWQSIAAKNSAMAGLINHLAVPELDEQATLRVMEDSTLQLEARHGNRYTYLALREAYRLAERYEHDMVFPGRAIRVMEGAVNHAQNGLVTEASVQASIEATLGVKVQKAGKEEKQELLHLEDLIHQRMVNQTRAVKVVADALRRARSGVNSPDKPIGTFLFLGPTGVGKTELAKAIASTYFSSEEQIIRIDMNEFTQSADIERLLDSSGENSLLAQIRRQPFAVVLFDEIEKAHPDVVNVFLQLLDEGVMRDSKNKEYSFKDAIVIATSNAGANVIREQIEAGKELEEFEAGFIDSLIKANLFKPEFLNRFDETVVFRPLKTNELLQVVDLMLASLNKTLARQKVAVDLTQEAKQWVVDNGNDPRLGARPLRRMLQRTVENVVAKRLLEDSFQAGTTLQLDIADLEAEHSR